jgi:hypothetical protein
MGRWGDEIIRRRVNERMEKWEERIIGSSVNGMMIIRLKTKRKYFKFTNRENIFRNDVRKLSRVGMGCELKENSESRIRGRSLTEGKQTERTV